MKKIILLVIIIFVLILPVSPLIAANFNADYVISDLDMTNYNSWNQQDIQNFLLSKPGTLDTYVDPKTKMLASQIIYIASQSHHINPKYLVVLLQKEQSLIENSSPLEKAYDWATGYAICDNCSKSDPKLQRFKGFTTQVNSAAYQTRYYFEEPGRFTYKKGQTHTIDGQRVTIQNQATANLYNYTPHIHGNQNLYNIWNRYFTKIFPDGSLLQDADIGGIYLIQNGYKRGFASKNVFTANGYDLNKVVPVSPTDLSNYENGNPIQFINYSLLENSGGDIYLLDNETKRKISSIDVFRKIGFNPEEIIKVSDEDLLGYTDGKMINNSSVFPTGTLLQDNQTGGVYWVQDNIKHVIHSKKILENRFKHYKITPKSPAQLVGYHTGDPVKFKDGELIKIAEDSAVYVISNGLRRKIDSEKIFNNLGYKWNQILTVSQKILEIHLLGGVISE